MSRLKRKNSEQLLASVNIAEDTLARLFEYGLLHFHLASPIYAIICCYRLKGTNYDCEESNLHEGQSNCSTFLCSLHDNLMTQTSVNFFSAKQLSRHFTSHHVF